jgi:ATP-dependent exoDNAse (exonuclease V) beta subunit
VHEALRYWRFPDEETALEPVLRSYAWSHHIIEENDVREAVAQSLDILEKFRQSDVYQWIEAAKTQKRPVYPELPFIYRVEKRIIHGVIDVLFQHEDGRWILVDYKTGYVPPQAAENHARRYYLQVGAYAAAVQAQIGVIPDVYIHFIRYNISVPVATAAWQAELAQLEVYTGDVIGSRYD